MLEKKGAHDRGRWEERCGAMRGLRSPPAMHHVDAAMHKREAAREACYRAQWQAKY
jgi:hypothetical protein